LNQSKNINLIKRKKLKSNSSKRLIKKFAPKTSH